jgi:hypothetical protein
MTRLISSPQEFQEIWSKVLQTVSEDATLPMQVFKPLFKHFRFVDFDHIASGPGWSDIVELLRASDCDAVYVGPLSPSPFTYYHEHFKHWSWWKIDATATDQDYWNVLVADPGNSEADALRYRTDIILLLAANGRFAVYADHDYEFAVVAAIDESIFSSLSELFTDTFSKLMFGVQGLPSRASEFEAAIMANYSENRDGLGVKKREAI